MATNVQTTNVASTAAASSFLVTIPVAPVAGETLILAVHHSDDYPAVPAGWTQIAQDALNSVLRVFTKTATGSEGTTITLTAPTSGSWSVSYQRWTGLSSLDVTANNNYDSDTNFEAGNLTTAAAGNLTMFGFLGVKINTAPVGVAWTAPMAANGAVATSSGATTLSILMSATRAVTVVGNHYAAGTWTSGDATRSTVGVVLTFVDGVSALSINAGVDQNVFLGATVNLAAVASGGSGARSYSWTKINGPSATFGTPSAATSTFVPSAAGTYTLRCIVTDASGTSQDDVVITVANAPTLVSYASVASSTGWTATGGTVQAVLADSSDSTLITSSDNPTNVLLDGTLAAVTAPAAGTNFVVRVRCRKIGASTGTLTGKLYDGTTLRSTVAVSMPNTLGDVDVIFPAADIAAIPSSTWTAGVRLTLSATAAV